MISKNKVSIIGVSICCLLEFLCVATIVYAQQYVAVPLNASDKELLQASLTVKPSERQLKWQEMEYYGFIHFGINTFTGQEWSDGTNSPDLFNPTALDAEQWVATFKNAGMKGLILTAKHHDGFCLWPTKTTNYSVAASPWRNGQGDLVREVSEACRRHGLKMGVYLSPWDRNHPAYGDSPVYNQVFREQLTELLTNYGELFEMWFDGANGEGPNGKIQVYDWESYYALIRRLQPQAVIAIMGPDVRWVGNEAGKGRDPEWSVLPVESASQKSIAEDSQQELSNCLFIPKNAKGDDMGSRHLLRGTRALIWYPSEVDTSIRPGWFYHPEQDNQVKSPEVLEEIYYNSVGMNSTLLLNVPPDRRGLLHENDIKSLMQLKERIENVFSNNLLEKAHIRYSMEDKNHSVQNLITKDKKVYWKAEDKDNQPILEFRFKTNVSFNRLVLQEPIYNGQRIEKFVLEIYRDKQWITVAEGKTVGYKRILSFPVVETKCVRVRFLSYRSAPELQYIGVFLSPGD
ncbi:MAG: alpha-L-fucosidase [Pigmentiphaga sp.]|nr:alpha-L-fucosidase [Pigmentiphaga sp.]